MGMFDKFSYKKIKEAPSQPERLYVRSSVKYISSNPKWKEFDPKIAFREGLKMNPYVFIAERRRSGSLSQAIIFGKERKSDGSYGRIDHTSTSVAAKTLFKLLRRPNPSMNMSQFVQRWTISKDLGGNVFAQKIRDAYNNLQELNILPVIYMSTDINRSTGRMDGYLYEDSYTKRPFELDEILHGMNYDPTNPYWGISLIQVLYRTLQTDNAAIDWNKASLENRGVTDGAFVTKEVLNEEEFKMAKEAVITEYANKDKGRVPWVLGGGMEYVQMSLTPIEMDFLNSRKFNREEISGVFEVPLPLMGVMDGMTFNNVDALKKEMWQSTLKNILEEFCDTLNIMLEKEFNGEVMVDFDTSDVDVLRDDSNKKVATNKTIADTIKVYLDMGFSMKFINKQMELGLTEEELQELQK